MSYIDALSQNGYVMFNKSLAKQIGINETLMMGELVQEHNYWESKNALEDNWFYSTHENISQAIGLSPKQQRMAVNHLQELDLIEIKYLGMPCKRYFRINQSQLRQKVTSSCDIW